MFNVFKKIFGFLSRKKKVTEDVNQSLLTVMKKPNNGDQALESSVFSKSPELIETLLKNNPDDKSGLNVSKEFWMKVMHEIPKEKCTYDETKFYVQKFVSWFGEDMLQDMIDGITKENIIGKISVSHEAEEVLNAFNDFFKKNLDDVIMILASLQKPYRQAA